LGGNAQEGHTADHAALHHILAAVPLQAVPKARCNECLGVRLEDRAWPTLRLAVDGDYLYLYTIS
jgi:hypothetical protein